MLVSFDKMMFELRSIQYPVTMLPLFNLIFVILGKSGDFLIMFKAADLKPVVIKKDLLLSMKFASLIELKVHEFF